MRLKLTTLFLCAVSLNGQTGISVSSTVTQTNTKRVGVNLGGHTYYDSTQIARDLVMNNPAFVNSIYSTMVSCDQAATTTTCQTGMYQTWTSGYFGSYSSTMRVITGTAAGCTSVITNYTPNTFTFTALTGVSPITGGACSTFAQSPVTNTDYIQVIKTITSSNSGSAFQPTFGWTQIGSGSSPTYSYISGDAPPSPSDGVSVYSGSLDMSASGSDYAGIQTEADGLYLGSAVAGRNFLDLNGTYTFSIWAKSVSGSSPTLFVNFLRGGTSYYSHTFALTGTWTQYTGTFSVSETGVQSNFLFLNLATAGTEDIRVFGASVKENSAIGDTSNFRDAVVTRLKALKPGIIRMWDGSTGDTSPLNNMLSDEYSRAPVGFLAGQAYPGYQNNISYSIGDFLRLAANIGSEAWIVVPPTITPTDASNLVDYLAGSSSTTYGAIRAAQGQTAPWTSIVSHIYLELGNEQWNSGFSGGDMAYNPAKYGALAQTLFGAMKSNSNWNSSYLSTVLGAQFQGTFYIQPIQNACNNNDYIDVGPYLMNTVSDVSNPNAWISTLAEPQILWAPVGSSTCMEFNNYSSANSIPAYSQPQLACPTEAKYSQTGSGGGLVDVFGGGIMAQNAQAEANAARSVPIAYYETNVDGTGSESALNQTQIYSYIPSLGIGLMNANNELESMSHGVNVQNIFQIGQDHITASGNKYPMWGIVEDMGGPTNGNRPTFWAAQMVNNAVFPGGNMLTTTTSNNYAAGIGSPTNTVSPPGSYSGYTNGSAINGVAFPSNFVQNVRAWTFVNSANTSFSMVLSNISVSTQAVTFSGSVVPTGMTSVTVLTSSSPFDNNETTTTTVVPTTSTLTSPTSYTLPAYSLVTLTWGASGPTAATYYVSNGGSDANSGTSPAAAWQTIAHVNTTTRVPGDTVLFNGGQTFTGELDSAVAGTSGNVITYGSYGTGTATINASGNNYGLNLTAPSYTTVTNLNIENAAVYDLYMNASASVSNETVTYVNATAAGSNGIYIFNSAGTATNQIVQHNQASGNGGTGIKIGSGPTGTASRTGASVKYNVTHNNSQAPSTTFADNGSTGEIYLVCPSNQACGSDEVAFNQVSNCGVGATVPGGFPVSSYGQGIWIDTATSVNSHNNSAVGCKSIGIYLEKTINSVSHDDYCLNGAVNGSGDFYGCITIAAGSSGIYGTYNSTGNSILNDTAQTTGKSACSMNFESTSGVLMSNNTWTNSLCIGNSGSGIYSMLMSNAVNNGTNGSGNILNYNGFGASPNFFFNGNNYTSYSTFESAWGVSTHSMQQDPLFWYGNNLLPGSPARYAGQTYTNAAVGQIFPAYPNLCGGITPDLGALRYNCQQTVTTGGSVTFTSPVAVNWFLQGAGSLSSTSGTSTTYTAPVSIANYQTMLGWSVLPPDSIFQTNISTLPVHANSSTWLSNASSIGFNFLSSWGVTPVDSTTPTYSVTPYYGDNQGNQPVYTIPFPGYQSVKRENGAYTSPSLTGNDHHTLTVNQTTGQFYEYYNEQINGLLLPYPVPFSLTFACKYTGSSCNVSSAIPPYSSSSYQMPTTSTDAPGLPLAPLTWTLADIEAGPTHAGRFTAALSYLNGSVYLWPATAAAAGGGASSPPYGSRWRLKSTYNISAACGSNQPCLNMLTAMQNYGLVLSDRSAGTSNQITVSSDAVEDPAVRKGMLLIQTANLQPSSFDIVDESALEQPGGLASYQTNPNNGLVTPSSYAVVTGGGSSVPIAFEPVGIGLQSNALAVAQGSYTYQITYWVTPGTVSQSVNWSRLSGTCSGDSVTTGGLYTPPTTGAPCTAVLKGVAAADSVSTAYLYISVFGLSGSGATSGYRIDVDSLPVGATTTDANANTWYNDFGVEASTANFYPSADYPVWFHPLGTNIPESTQYGSYLYTYGGDIRYCAVVPNGNYQVRFGQGQNWNGTSYPQGSVPLSEAFTNGPNFLSVNGVIESHFLDWEYATGYQWAVPSDTYIPVKVTNHQLCAQTQKILPDSAITVSTGLAPLYNQNGTQTYPQFATPACISAQNCGASSVLQLLEILPDSTSPFLSLDTQQVNRISPGQTIRLYPVDHYTGVTLSSTTYSISFDPWGNSTLGTVNSTDGSVTVTAGSGTILAGQPLLITATNGGYTATTVFYSTGARRPFK